MLAEPLSIIFFFVCKQTIYLYGHRIMLHENLGEAHRKHAYQIMANELKIGHVKVTLLYMAMQLAVSLGFVYICPDTVSAIGCI